jgi:MFS family permease
MPKSTPSSLRTKLPFAIILLGFTSFFGDVAAEMIFPLLPAFLATLGAGTAFLGLVEGVADAVSSLLKLLSGYAAEQSARRKPLVLLGYGLAGLVRPLVALATAPWQVMAVRVTDRVGKGLRTSPRDVLIAAAAAPGEAGRAFGFHRAMDHGGAVVGPLIATLLLALGMPMRHVFLVAFLPGALSLLTVFMVREPDIEQAPLLAGPAPVALALPSAVKRYFLVLALFSLGNASDAFLLVRARELGVPLALLPMLWSLFHVSKVVCAYLGGDLSDRMSRARLIVAGWCVYAVTYLCLGLATQSWQAWALFVVYGAYYGMTEPAEKALIKDLVPAAQHGRAFGYYNFIAGATAIPAGLLTGYLWQSFGAFTALATGASVATMAAISLALWERSLPTPALQSRST